MTTKKSKKKSERIVALDAARGLAVIGMFIQHFALNERNNFVSGNTMILFILCSGISYSIMSNRMEKQDVYSTVFRTRILSRSVFIDLAGYLLIMLNGPFSVVLPTYAMLFLLALLLVGCSTRFLATLSTILFFITPPLMLIGMSLFSGVDLLTDIAGGPLSALAWLPVFVTGMVLGRLKLRNRNMPFCLIMIGLVISLPMKLFALFFLSGLRTSFETLLLRFPMYSNPQPIDPYAIWPLNTQPVLWQMLLVDAPQGGSTFELLIGTGLSLIIIGVLLLIEKYFDILLKPFQAVGHVALTLYAAQFLIVWILKLVGIDIITLDIGSLPFGDGLIFFAVIVVGILLDKLPNGPFENLLQRFERIFV